MRHHKRIVGELIYRDADGHTYWKDRTGEWQGAPTFRDGSVDFEQAGAVADFDLEPAELAELLAELERERAAQPARDPDAWRYEFGSYYHHQEG